MMRKVYGFWNVEFEKLIESQYIRVFRGADELVIQAKELNYRNTISKLSNLSLQLYGIM
jgi:hypothetical protein